MIGPSGTVQVMVATKPIDFHKGMEGLAMLVREHMKADPFSGAVYVFRARRADRIKLILWDGTGLCLFAKRLEEGVCRWPKIEDGVMRLSAVELSTLLGRASAASTAGHCRRICRGSKSSSTSSTRPALLPGRTAPDR
ncbi:IS66 family insertion sequence element accessory protein TnpB [Bradyrhizobium sp. USDA 4451]